MLAGEQIHEQENQTRRQKGHEEGPVRYPYFTVMAKAQYEGEGMERYQL